MAVPPSVPTILGGLAVFTTVALLAVHAILVYELAHRASSPAYTAAIAAIALEGAALLALSAHLASHLRRSRSTPSSEKQSLRHFFSTHGPWLLSSGLVCTAAATVSVLALVRLAKAPAVSNAILGTNAVPFVCGASVTLGICYIAQLLFLVALLSGRSSSSSTRQQAASLENGYGKTSRSVSDGSNGSGSSSGGSNDSSKHSPSLSSRIKAVPYSKTRAEKTQPSTDNGAALSKRSGLRNSLRLSLPHVVRPVTSKTRLLSPSHRNTGFLASWGPAMRGSAASSLPSTAPAAAHELATRPSIEDFDSWDTSAVDPQSRRTVLASFASTSSLSSSSSSRPTVVPASRFLETIPASPSASPSVSRSASPGTPLDLPHLQPQRHQRRRSDSPAASARAPAPLGTRTRAKSHSQLSQHSPPPIPVFPPPPRAVLFPLPPPPSPSEAHIHPLFRSDSPNPAPSVSSAGTVVTAAPNGGQVLAAADATGLRTLNRMRSGSFPVVASPLSRQGSFDAWPLRPGTGGGSRGGSRGGSSDGRSRMEEQDRTAFVGEGVDDERGEDEDDEDDEETRRRVRADSGAERKMTPPIPEWILSAGARRSLSGYQNRRGREAS